MDDRPLQIDAKLLSRLDYVTEKAGVPRQDAPELVVIAAGATDDGPPGDRGGGFWGAYFRDPDGNKVCVYRFNLG